MLNAEDRKTTWILYYISLPRYTPIISTAIELCFYAFGQHENHQTHKQPSTVLHAYHYNLGKKYYSDLTHTYYRRS